ncbi:hypothetical protein A2480_04135 [Candidatus Uhrbacteria bacterium RIFOXYC2_FULL_47_19]|uniref:FAD/NAD(P)-binding domain-containing protein n=1 Tax=Candidatus Uhrbacteria bacterium RIFOXYC2_FULL_47_19 TaxID=1802424 RepID=A0A1F7WC84_9BACT|nr:MAG: hypothetical protein A2480_04135 [Candidatus Uhrbacteria bacterium RIFOXYC2_FULL_47_19]HCC22296.1 hypothetical protein [Candidatus Uhrbacteria bacterium]
MEKYDYLIIGGGIAGTTAAETLKKEKPSARVAIVSDEPYPLYSRILLSKPNLFLGKIPFETIWMRQPEHYAERGIDFLSGHRAEQLSTKDNKVTLDDGIELGFGQLLLATGCPVRQLNVPGLAEKTGVSYMKTVNDAQAVMTEIKHAKRAVVIGAGFVSFEMCNLLRLAGLGVDVVVRESYFWEPVLDQDAGQIIERALIGGGVTVRLNSEIAEVLGQDKVEGVKLKDGTSIDCDLLVIGIGVQFDGGWLEQAGITVGRGIRTNEYLKTNLDGIWAAGDVAELNDPAIGEPYICGTWLDAQEQGRTAALNMLGKRLPYRIVSSYTSHGFGLSLVFVGQVRCKDSQLFPRGRVESNSYGCLVVRNNQRIAGAFLINRGEDLAPIKSAIESAVNISNQLELLSDPESDLMALLPKD